MRNLIQGILISSSIARTVLANDGAVPAVEVESPAVEVAPVETGIEKFESDAPVDPSIIQTLALPECDHTSHEGEACPKEIDSEASFQIMTLGGNEIQDRGGGLIAPNHRNIEMMSQTGAMHAPDLRGQFSLNEERRNQSTATLDRNESRRPAGLWGRLMGKPAPKTALISRKQHEYAQEMAEIDRLRDQALKSGNREQLRLADKKEAELKSRVRISTAKAF